VVRWISTVGNYDYIFDWVFHDNGTIGIDAGATGTILWSISVP
jgi:Cu2+-containing amine oxidase